ncbi:unnamed protein product [Toxocara canis]|uniref:Protein kinase domain-containing protein n=1 Tax=Toxocara canis TaxID=6265 RepID=A0A183U920_TOXCA|nr:unnamed protein product [Toxocara canis]
MREPRIKLHTCGAGVAVSRALLADNGMWLALKFRTHIAPSGSFPLARLAEGQYIKEYDRRANLWNVLNAQGCGAFSRKVHSVSYAGVVMDIV